MMREKSHPGPDYYDKDAQTVKKFEAAYGEDWDGTMIEYDNDFVGLPHYVGKAANNGNIRTVLQWLGKGNINEKLNAKSDVGWDTGLLHLAAASNQHDLMGYLLLKGADTNILNSKGMSVLTVICRDKRNLKFVELLLSWGAEHYREGKQVTKEMKLNMCGDLSRFCDRCREGRVRGRPGCRGRSGAGRGRFARGVGPGRPGRSEQQCAEDGEANLLG